MAGERDFKLFFVCVDARDIKLMREMDWKYWMISVVYWDRVKSALDLFDVDNIVMLDNGYITKFANRVFKKGEEVPLEERIEWAETVLRKYEEIHEILEKKGIRHFMFDFDFFLGEDEYKYRKHYLQELVRRFGAENVFVVYHENEEEHLKWARNELGIDKVAISSALGSKVPYDFHTDFGFSWVHYFGTFSDVVFQQAILGKVDSADISSWSAVQRFGIVRKFENGNWQEEEIGADIKLDKEKWIKVQIEEYKKAVQYIDDMINTEVKLDPNHIYCDSCPLKEKCPHYRQGGTCFVEEMEEVKPKDDIVDELLTLAKDLKKKMYYERLKAQATGLTASKLELNLLSKYVSLITKAEDLRLKRLEVASGSSKDEEEDELLMELLSTIKEGEA